MAVLERLKIVVQEIRPLGKPGFGLSITYLPIIDGSVDQSLQGTFALFSDESGQSGERSELFLRWTKFRESTMRFGREMIEVDGTTREFQRSMTRLVIESGTHEEDPTPAVYLKFEPPGGQFLWYAEPDSSGRAHTNYLDKLTDGERRLLESLLVSLKNSAWTVLHRSWFGEPISKPQVFISYRTGHEAFAQALAERLGAEGFIPWFDRWEILAGDSVTGKIEEGLRHSMAFISVLTADYHEGRWATEELESAIARRIEEGFPIIPVLLEPCKKPELIRHLRHVDFSDQDPDTFESRVADVIDGVNRLSKNPFR
jgi:TIR domain